jgi:hypothetical protein
MTSKYTPTSFKRTDWSRMVGTEKTGTYVQCAQSAWGMVGYREYRPGEFRIRIEPTEAGVAVLAPFFTRDRGWKQPGDSGQNRFSNDKVKGQQELERVLRLALYALASDGNQPVLKRDCPVWAKRFLRRDALEAFVRQFKLPGHQLVSTWSMPVLLAKAATITLHLEAMEFVEP